MTKPTTLQELKTWVESHSEDGKINGQCVVVEGTTEFRTGIVPGWLYDEVLLKGAALSFTKSQIGTCAFVKFLENPIDDFLEKKILQIAEYEATTEFRCYIPNALYNLAIAVKERLQINNSQLMTLALGIWANDLTIVKLFELYIDDLAQSHQKSRDEIYQAIFDYRRLEARKQRLKMSEKLGYFVTDRKIAT